MDKYLYVIPYSIYYIILYYIILYYNILYYIILCYVMSYYIVLYYIVIYSSQIQTYVFVNIVLIYKLATHSVHDVVF